MGRPEATPSIKHLMLTLLLLNQSSLGRYTLSNYLGISKAKTRTILEYIIDNRIAQASRGRGGTSLTSTGYALVEKLKRWIHLDWKSDVISVDNGFIPSDEMAIMLMNVDDTTTSGLYERDMAVREGAEGAITIIKKSDIWLFPDDKGTEASQINIHVENVAKQYNMMSISFGSNRGSAYAGAAAIVMYHLGEKINSILEI